MEVPAGDVWELLQFSGAEGYIKLIIDGTEELSIAARYPASPDSITWTGLNSYNSQSGSGVTAIETRKPLVAGPASLDVLIQTYSGGTNFQGSLVYRRITNQAPPPALPSNTVVIPTDATGPVQIILESSQDLVNWTAAEPGTYGSGTNKRFFRLRAVVTQAP